MAGFHNFSSVHAAAAAAAAENFRYREYIKEPTTALRCEILLQL